MTDLLTRFSGRASTKVAALTEVPLFDRLPRRQVEFLAAHLDEVAVQEPGTTLIREGRHNDAFWILLDGEVDVSAGGRHRRKVTRGGFFGATSMLDGRPAAATVVTATPIRALVASSEQFRALEANDTIALRLMSGALERLRRDVLATASLPS